MATAAAAQESAAQKYLISVERISDRAPHSALTDLIEFNKKTNSSTKSHEGPRRNATQIEDLKMEDRVT
jgi:hypothetical protein